MAIAGYEMGKALIRILGLPDSTRSFELKVAPDEVVTIKCEYFPSLPDGGRALFTELREYQLVEKPDSEDIKSPYLGTHHKKNRVEIPVKDVAKQLTLKINVSGMKQYSIRLAIARFFIRLASRVAMFNIKVEGMSNEHTSNHRI